MVYLFKLKRGLITPGEKIIPHRVGPGHQPIDQGPVAFDVKIHFFRLGRSFKHKFKFWLFTGQMQIRQTKLPDFIRA
jgi:hypothetical protein